MVYFSTSTFYIYLIIWWFHLLMVYFLLLLFTFIYLGKTTFLDLLSFNILVLRELLHRRGQHVLQTTPILSLRLKVAWLNDDMWLDNIWTVNALTSHCFRKYIVTQI